MKILDDWKVYGGVSDLKQHAEGIPVSQVIINSNYSDDHDDYDIALMKLSRPLTLSGEVSQQAVPQGWAGAGVQGTGRALGMDRSERRLGAPRSHTPGCTRLLPAGASRSAVAILLCPACLVVRNRPSLPGQGPAHRQPWAGLCRGIGQLAVPHMCSAAGAGRDPGWVGAGGSSLRTPLLPSHRAGDYSSCFALG